MILKDKKYNSVFEFGKVAYNEQKNKSNLVTLKVTLEIVGDKTKFSASGNIWNSTKTDIYMGGQCIDDIYNQFKREIENRKTYESIMTLWEKWHLNDLKAGCIHQRAEKWEDVLLDESKPKTQDNMASWTYPKDNPKGLLTKKCKKCGYKYGSAWLYEPIDKVDLSLICRLLNVPFYEAVQIIKLGV